MKKFFRKGFDHFKLKDFSKYFFRKHLSNLSSCSASFLRFWEPNKSPNFLNLSFSRLVGSNFFQVTLDRIKLFVSQDSIELEADSLKWIQPSRGLHRPIYVLLSFCISLVLPYYDILNFLPRTIFSLKAVGESLQGWKIINRSSLLLGFFN